MRPLFLLCLCVTATQAADLNTAVTQGQELPLGTYYEIDRGSCQALAAPRVRLGEKPRLGRATVVKLQRQRSEEHTSELQSRENLVCRLLLEKKKTQRW